MSRTIYTLLLSLLLPFTILKLLWRAKKQPAYLQHWCERYGFYTQTASKHIDKPIIWLHCVSVGETMAAAPLIKMLLANYPQHSVLITHTTPTGRDTSLQLFGDSYYEDKIARCYLPYDVPFAVNRFLNHFKPALGMLMETELWFNTIAACKVRNIPILLINARLSEKSARGYGKLGQLVCKGLQNLTHIAAQTEQDSSRLAQLGAANISVVGNIKFDVSPPPNAAIEAEKLRNSLLQNAPRPIFLAASTRHLNGVEEEALILDAVEKAAVPNLLTIIVPRHPQRFNDVEKLLQKRGLRYLKRSTLHTASAAEVSQVQVLLGDSMGEMFTYYALCDVAFIGGSLLNLGGQNIIEACAMAKPTLVGPYTFNFTQVVAQAILQGACLRVSDGENLATTLNTLFENAAIQQKMQQSALNFSQLNQGATLRVLDLLGEYLSENVSINKR